jgi:antitoxin HicB
MYRIKYKDVVPAVRIPLVFFLSAAGTEPVRDWLRALPDEDCRTIGQDLMRVQWRWPIGMPLCRSLGDGLWEGAYEPAEPSHRTGHLRLSRRGTRGTARVHQEEPEDTDGRSRSRGRTQEGADAMTRQPSRKPRHPRHGSSLDACLAEKGTLETFQAVAIKEVIAWQISEAMAKQRLSKNQMARQMKTSRAQLDRLLDPAAGNVTIETLQRAANVLGREIRLELV